MSCRICGASEGQTHTVKEMMFGTREEFLYFECGVCGCLQLENPPADMSAYYPDSLYYAFQQESHRPAPASRLRRWFKRQRDGALLFERGGIFGWLSRRYPNPGLADVKRWLAPTPVRSFADRILDVGCGRGDLLFRLADLGFQNLTGIDPYTHSESNEGPVRIVKGSLESLPGQAYDLIMFHHSFEHMPDPIEALKAAKAVLALGGVCLIRLPIASQGLWKIYGTNWAEIDAPRHFFLHTEFSLSLVAAEAGLSLVHIDYEAEPFSYAASEMYRRGQSLYSREKNRCLSWWEPFSSPEIAEFQLLARKYNVPGWAGRAGFYFAMTSKEAVSVDFLESQSSGPPH